jgi:hypothetical protein
MPHRLQRFSVNAAISEKHLQNCNQQKPSGTMPKASLKDAA